jgi:hypothetical protein
MRVTGTSTKRQVLTHPVSKRLVSKRQIYKTSGLQNVRFQNVSGFKMSTEIKASKRPVFKFDILFKQKV